MSGKDLVSLFLWCPLSSSLFYVHKVSFPFSKSFVCTGCGLHHAPIWKAPKLVFITMNFQGQPAPSHQLVQSDKFADLMELQE